MDDRHSQFLIVVADMCLGSALGRLTIEIDTVHGARVAGIPAPDTGEAASVDGEIDPESTVRIEGREVRLGDITACHVNAPPVAVDPSSPATLGADS